MRNKIKRSICSFLMSLLMVVSFGMEVFAAPQNTNYNETLQLENEVVQLDCEMIGFNQFIAYTPYATTFVDAAITISFSSEGMHITICTGMNDVASLVGVKDIEVHRKKLFGYELVAVADGGEAYNVTTGVCSLLYSGAIQGEKYRVVCTHYGDVDGYREMYAETDWVTCNY